MVPPVITCPAHPERGTARDIEKVSGGNGDDAPARPTSRGRLSPYIDGDSLIDVVGRRDGRSTSFEPSLAVFSRWFVAVVVVVIVASNFYHRVVPRRRDG